MTAVLQQNGRMAGRIPMPLPLLSSMDITRQFFGQVRISPACCSWVLDRNTGNRRRRITLVDYLSRQIIAGEWQGDHPQPIVFSVAGRLIDGQHRIFAILKANMEVTATVLCGSRDELREYIDTGISRTLEDRVSFDQDLGTNKRVGSIISAWMCLEKNKVHRVTPAEAMDTFNLHKEAILFAADFGKSHQKGITTSSVMVAAGQMYERDGKKACEFTASLVNPDGPVQQARMLRDYLLRAAGGGSAAQRERYQKSVGCMKSHLEGRDVLQVRCNTW